MPYLVVGNEYEIVLPVHWMSRKPHYRDFLLDNILPTHPELLYSRTKDGKRFFNLVAQEFIDPNFTFHCLQIPFLPSFALEMTWRDYIRNLSE